MKAILVIDMPKDCWDCPMHIDGLDDECEEIMVCKAMERESHYGKKPNWCPMKPVPKQKDLRDYAEKIDSDFNLQIRMSDYINGYNKCIDEILEEEE